MIEKSKNLSLIIYLYNLIASKVKHIRRGVKEVGKAVRKGEKGLVVIAGDISPMDVISHLPVLCEDHDIPYVFVPSKEKLGEASQTKRPTSVAMIVFGGKTKDEKAAEDYKELYDECYSSAKELVSFSPLSFFDMIYDLYIQKRWTHFIIYFY